ncbi:NAD(+) synthase [Planctobacterium marinum]|uniref:NAD(+) synthase n=1 Tax=Planctobacterium marinum TaxID=1631968 RepID=UPI001E5F8F2C|nr:NAD(+) synthase [Planctobacterium marinum]MCC2607899.1 NAD(+) synthase [Planctobacterium marinum]
MKIALAQMHVVPMELEKNLQTMLRMIDDAKQQHADVVVFPELCISGYLLSDQWLNRQFCQDLMQYNERLLEASRGITLIYGNICEIPSNEAGGFHPNKDGRSRLYNAAYVMHDGAYAKRPESTEFILPEGIHPKALLPNYRFFDDQRYFFSLVDVAQDFAVPVHTLAQPFVIPTAGGDVKIGVEVCEDLWCKDYRIQGESVNVSKYLIQNGAEMLVNISASPWTFHKNDARDRRLQFLKAEIEQADLQFVPFYYTNNVGAQNNGKNIITFDGDTSAYNHNGQLAANSAKPFRQTLLLVDHEAIHDMRVGRSETDKIAQKYQAIVTGLRHIPELLGWQEDPKFVIGLSGGVDSALVACLLKLAFGAENVWTVNMPTQYNSSKTKDAAAWISKKLGVRHIVVPIQTLVEEQMSVFAQLDASCESPDWMRKLSDENIQAKIRGTSILSNIAGRYGRMFTNNGNKVEIALGYATLYGDVGGVIAPIGDLTKAEVFDMVRYLNRQVFKDEVIPESLLPDDQFRFTEEAIAPSAELRDAQIDPMKFGYHCQLLEACTSFQKVTAEDVMGWYLQGCLAKKLNMDEALIPRWGIDDPGTFMQDLEWFYDGIRKSVFKRIQSPPIVLTSPSAYGFDIRESQLPNYQGEKYQQLKQQVLAMQQYSEQA